MNPVVLILSILDLVAGLLVFSSYSGLETLLGKVILYVSIFHLIKGAWSIVSSFVLGYIYDVLGWIDLLSGILIILALNGIVFHFAYIFAIIMIIKGLYCILFSF